MKKIITLLLAVLMVMTLAACGNNGGETATETEEVVEENNFKIAIITGTRSQGEDDISGAEALLAKYPNNVVLANYPDNFGEELETTIQTIVNFADDPDVKAIVVNQGVPGTSEAFRQVKEKRDDIICLTGEDHDFPDTIETADVTVNNNFVDRGYLMVHTAHELGCTTFVHISFARHLSYYSMQRRIACMQKACEELGMEFASELAPDPSLADSGYTAGAVAYVQENVPLWVEKYGQDTAFFCTNDAHTAPLIEGLIKYGGYFIEADLPSPLLGYQDALGISIDAADQGDFDKICKTVEDAVVAAGGEGRFGTWACSYGFTLSAGLGQHAYNVLTGESELQNLDDIIKAFGEFSDAEWSGSKYVDEATGVKYDNAFLVYQDTYIFGKGYMNITDVEVPEYYYTLTPVDLN